MVGSFALLIPIYRYYDHLFGRVTRRLTSVGLEIAAGGICALLVSAAFWMEITFKLPFSPLGLAMTIFLLFVSLRMWRRLSRVFVTGLCSSALMAIVSILPVLGIPNWWSAVGMKNHILGVTLVYSLIMIVSGILSHIYFAYSLSSAPEAVNE